MRLTVLMAASAMSLLAAQAQATTFTLNLSGSVAGFSYFSFNVGHTHYDQANLALPGYTPIVVSQGDTINTTVTLDAPFTIPASQQYTSFDLSLTDPNFPATNTSVTGTTTFFDAGNQVASIGPQTTLTSSQLDLGALSFPPNNGALTFDKVTSDFTINTLANPTTLSTASISYTLVSVPEPMSWTLMLVGLGALGGVMRRRKRLARA